MEESELQPQSHKVHKEAQSDLMNTHNFKKENPISSFQNIKWRC